jgi:membrane-associated protease RseP (regulator of RpoE activity)
LYRFAPGGRPPLFRVKVPPRWVVRTRRPRLVIVNGSPVVVENSAPETLEDAPPSESGLVKGPSNEDRGDGADGPELGMKLTELDRAGTAAEAGLRPGDIFVSVDGLRVASADDVRPKLAGKSEVEVVFVNVDNGGLESVRVGVRDGLLGVTGETVELPE